MKFLFIGYGSIAKRHISNLIMLESELFSGGLQIELVTSKTFQEIELVHQSFVKMCFVNLDEVESWYDAIFITNITSLHFETLKRSQHLSDHFFLEKPAFHSGDLNLNNFDLFRKIIYVACPLRHSKVFNAIMDFVNKNEVLSARAIVSSYLPDWRKGRNYSDSYSASTGLGGGVGLDLIHEWDYLVDLFGFPTKTSVFEAKLSKLDIESNDIYIAIGDSNKTFIELHLDYFGKVELRLLQLITNYETVEYDFLTSSMRDLSNKKTINFDEEINEFYISEIRYFVSLIYGKVENINNLNHALNVIRLMENKK